VTTNARPRRTVLRLTFAGRMLLPVAAAGIIAAWLFGGTIGLFAVTALAVLALSPVLGWLHVRSLELVLPAHARAPVGEFFPVQLEVKNRARWFAAREVVISAGDELTDDPRPAGLLALLLPRHTETIALSQRLIERGRKREVALLAFSTFPFGLVRCGLSYRIRADLLGLPRLGSLTDLRPLPAARPEQALDRRFAFRGEEEFWGVRDWRAGESLRRVHWRLTAKRDRLIQREYRPQARPPVTILLCTQVAELGPWTRRDPSFEKAVSVAATLAEHYLRAGGLVRLELTEPGRGAPPVRGRSGFGSVLVALAEVQGRQGDPWEALRQALRRSPGAATRRGSTVAVLAGGGSAPHIETSAVILDVDGSTIDAVFRRGAQQGHLREDPPVLSVS